MILSEIVFLCVIILISYLISQQEDIEESEEEIHSLEGYSEPRYEDEEMFYHPVTGYKGTRDQMDAYIQNRERDMRNGDL